MDLYQKHRPTSFKQIVGQEAAKKMLTGFIKKNKVPHAILFKGPSGTGKTTMARILKTKLNCSDYDFQELNGAERRGIDDVREIQSRMNRAPIGGDCRIFLIDEAHKLTGDAQTALLKMLEDTPTTTYFMLATTDPQKLLNTIRTRCTDITLSLLNDDDLEQLIFGIAEKEKIELTINVADKIAEASQGSARKAVVLLNSISQLKTEDEQLDAIEKADEQKAAIDLCRMLFDDKAAWPKVAKLLKEIEGDAENIRWAILGYARSVLLNAGGPKLSRAALIIEAFEDNFYNTKNAGLTKCCYFVMTSR